MNDKILINDRIEDSIESYNLSFFERDLPKWPGLLVLGDKVTKEQAIEILIRTDGLNLSSNDSEFDRQLGKIVFGIDCKNSWSRVEEIKKLICVDDWVAALAYEDECRKKVGHIDEIYYLSNSQIVSIWVGGPKGWCDWNGNIRTCNYNIGKWPSVEEVYNEWVIIAKEFPFLNLKAQLLDAEINQDDHEEFKVVVEYVIKDGKVEMQDAEWGKLLLPMEEVDYKNFMQFNHERGLTIEEFKIAYDYNIEQTKIRNQCQTSN